VEPDAGPLRLDRRSVAPLLARRDAPALARLAIQSAAFLAAAAAAFRLGAAGSVAAPLAVLAAGLALAPFFAVLHECGHRTAFRTPALNDAAAWVAALLMLQAPSFFRAFHAEHHRSTQDRERDPEVAGAPDLLLGWPQGVGRYLLLASGQALMVGKALFTGACAGLPRDAAAWDARFAFVRREERARVARESRVVVLVWGLALAGALVAPAGAGWVLAAWPVAHGVLGLYLMPEHTGLPETGSQLERTRSMHTHAAVRWAMWNMPLHAEHHAFPAVPFHALPRLHGLLRPHLRHRAPGYLAFHREALRRAAGRAP